MKAVISCLLAASMVLPSTSTAVLAAVAPEEDAALENVVGLPADGQQEQQPADQNGGNEDDQLESETSADQSAEALAGDLPPSCAVLVLASQNLLDLLQDDDLFRLPAPVSKGDLTASVRMLLQMGRRLERALRPRRSPEEQALIQQAKALLMDRNGMTEEQAHRFLQKTSMDNGTKLLQTAQMVLDSAE